MKFPHEKIHTLLLNLFLIKKAYNMMNLMSSDYLFNCSIFVREQFSAHLNTVYLYPTNIEENRVL